MTCFWTDLIGVSQECASAIVGSPLVVEWVQYPGSFPTAQLWPVTAVTYAFTSTGSHYTYSFSAPDVALPASLTIKRVQYLYAPGSGCSIAEAAPPAWFPASVAALGGLTLPGYTTYEADNLSLATTPSTDSSSNPNFTCNIVSVLLASGAPDGTSDGVFFLEAVGSDGVHYYGFGNINGCF